MGVCRGSGAVFQPVDSPASVLFSSRPSHLSPRRALSKAEDLEPRLLPLPSQTPPCSQHHYCPSQFFGIGSQLSRTRDYLDRERESIFTAWRKNKAARLLDTKQTPRAKRATASERQNDATPSPAYYLQFLLEKVNLMSIIGS